MKAKLRFDVVKLRKSRVSSPAMPFGIRDNSTGKYVLLLDSADEAKSVAERLNREGVA
jgi:hypothetical protein